MTEEVRAALAEVRQRRDGALRVCLDVNVWVSYLIALSSSRQTAGTVLVDIVRSMQSGSTPVQLVLAHELLDTLDRVLREQGFLASEVEEFTASLDDLTKAGPEGLDPSLVLTGRGQLAMHDREDAGVLAACIGVRADLLVTDNLRHFGTNDSERIDTQEITYRDGRKRQLYAVIHERADGLALVVMHPIDALTWLKDGKRPTAEMVREQYAANLLKEAEV